MIVSGYRNTDPSDTVNGDTLKQVQLTNVNISLLERQANYLGARCVDSPYIMGVYNMLLRIKEEADKTWQCPSPEEFAQVDTHGFMLQAWTHMVGQLPDGPYFDLMSELTGSLVEAFPVRGSVEAYRAIVFHRYPRMWTPYFTGRAVFKSDYFKLWEHLVGSPFYFYEPEIESLRDVTELEGEVRSERDKDKPFVEVTVIETSEDCEGRRMVSVWDPWDMHSDQFEIRSDEVIEEGTTNE